MPALPYTWKYKRIPSPSSGLPYTEHFCVVIGNRQQLTLMPQLNKLQVSYQLMDAVGGTTFGTSSIHEDAEITFDQLAGSFARQWFDGQRKLPWPKSQRSLKFWRQPTHVVAETSDVFWSTEESDKIQEAWRSFITDTPGVIGMAPTYD